MWPIPTLDHRLVTIIFSLQDITCCWIEKTSGAAAPFLLRAYKKYSLFDYELEKLILFNPSRIKKYIQSFLDLYGLQNAFVAFCFDGPSIIDHYIPMTTSTPSRKDFSISQSHALLWQYSYLYQNDHGQYVFYVYAVPRLVVLQYQLLGIALRCNLLVMTSKKAALLEAYKHIFGTAFRKTQLALDMMRFDNDLEGILSIDLIKRVVSVPLHCSAQADYSAIAIAYGMLNSERI